MPPGASDTRDNMFALLADSPPGKRKKRQTFSPFPDLAPVPKENPKYIVISVENPGKTISDYSCFAVYKAIQTISKEINSITQLRDGNLLLLVKNQKIATKFINTTHIPLIGRIKCIYHESLNFTKGTIYAPYLSSIPEDEIITELKDQGVKSVYKFLKNINGKQEPSGVILLTFDLYNLPSKIDICWHSVRVREYIPNPMRCKTCQLLGHTKKWCKNTPTCVQCNLPPHHPEECTRIMCANCHDPHPSSSVECKIFQQQKAILKIKTQQKCSLSKATKIYRDQNTPPLLTTNYAQAPTNTQLPNTGTLISQNKTNNNANNKNNHYSGEQNSTNNNANKKEDDEITCLNRANGSETSNNTNKNNNISNNMKELHKSTELNPSPTTTKIITNKLNKPTNKLTNKNSKEENNITQNNSTSLTDTAATLKTKSSSTPTPTLSYNSHISNNNISYPETTENKPSVSFDIEMSDTSHSEVTNNTKNRSYKLRSSQLET